MILLRDLCFSFAESRRTLFFHDQFSFPAGKLVFVEGKNGAGKSTLFHILTAQPELRSGVSGTLIYHGINYDLASQEYARFAEQHIAQVPQRFDEVLAPHLTIQENLACAHLPAFPSFSSRVVLPPLPQLARSLGISTEVPVQFLSGGQRQIVAILTMLQTTPSLLLLDEPTATLDEENSILVMECIKTLIAATGITVLMITHDSSLLSYSDVPSLVIRRRA